MIRVMFEQGLKTINWLDKKCYVMIETSGLFEAYRHVLRALQSMKDTLPFENYILKCRPNVAIPRYIRDKAEVKFNLIPLLEKNVCIIENKLGIFNDSDLTSDQERISRDLRPSTRTLSTHFARNVDIMDYKSWPSCELLNLDESQFRALQASLTKELSIVQGPPGTGKSFIGLQIVKILLKNQHVWQWREEKVTNRPERHVLEPENTSVHLPVNHGMFSNNTATTSEQSTCKEIDNVSATEDGQIHTTGDMQRDEEDISDIDTHSETIYDRRPILLVCYTNHALDQFLEGILQFYKGDVLRVGSRSKSSLLEKHNLSSVKRNFRLSGALRESIRNARNETIQLGRCAVTRAIETDILSRNLINLDSLVDLSFSSILKLEGTYYRWTIQDENHCRQQGYMKLLEPSVTVIWLDLFGKLNEIAFEQKRHKQKSVRKDKEIQAKDTQYFVSYSSKLYDISNEDPATVEDITADLLSHINVAYSPQTSQMYNHKIQNEFASYIKAQLESTDMMTDEEAEYFSDDISAPPLEQRWRMYRRFVENRRRAIEQDAKEDLIKLEKANAKLRELELQKDKVVMKKATIIGMTTTCAAKYHVILNEVKPRIIIIEEAAEVLESHIISCLNPYCDQLILIGDHEQLRPKVETYDLANRYLLDVSLFERMVKNGINYECLQRQHRMRPVIADVIRHIYPELEDDVAVKQYPNIGGIAHNLFCVSHSFAETYDEEQRSFSNEHEAKFAVSLAYYVMQQGYDASKITILTTYKGQLFLLKRILQDKNMDNSKLTVSVVDNYQGEENDIVILSLVRSNENGKIGFLKKANRICVALSRAKMGLYIIGDIEKLAHSSELWKDIMSDLQLKHLIGSSLPLYCQNHSTEQVYASSCEDFKQVPDGGCNKPCEWRLDCGHVCERKCHIVDSKHEGIRCTKPCIRSCKNGHRCRKRCDKDFGNCCETILRTLECGHMNAIPCYRDNEFYICEAVCNKQLDCGHICDKPCSESCSPCEVTCKASLLRCKHEVDIVCSVSKIPICQLPCSLRLECGHDCTEACQNIQTEFTNENETACGLGHITACQKRCETVLACKHRCNYNCFSCFGKRLHVQCSKRCNCDLACGHGCEGMCSECFPCERHCKNSCPHGRCMKRCKEPCQKCDKPCEWKCDHFKCTQPCGETCNRQRCDERCTKLLKCGHICIGLCGEPCPSKCLTRNEHFLGKVGITGIGNNAPCVVQLEECKHIVDYRQMDKYMDEKDKVIRLKRCPVCAKPIRRSKRYGNVVKEILRKIEMLKKDAIKVAQEDELVSTKIDLNVQSIKVCLEKIDDYFGRGASGLSDSTLIENVVLGNCQLHSTMTLSNKQFLLDISLEIRRRFDVALLNMLKMRLSLADASLKTTTCMIQLKKRYDADIQNVVKEIIEKMTGECQGVRPAILDIKVVEIDPAAGEADKNESTAAEINLDHQPAYTGVNQQESLTETASDEPKIFHLQLYINKELPYYKCGKSQMDQSKGQLCRVEPNGNQDISRKDRCSDHSREQICIVDLPDGKHLKQPISLKRKHTRNDNDGDRAKVKKLTTSAHKVLERPSTQPSRLKIDEKPETKRKQTELKAVPEKKVRTEKERCSDHPEGNNDGDDQSVLEALLKRDEDADAVVQILDDYNDSPCIGQHSTQETDRRQHDWRDREPNSRKSSPHPKTSKRNNTNKDNIKSTGSRHIKQHSIHETESRNQDRRDWKGKFRKSSPHSKTSKRDKTFEDNFLFTDSRYIKQHSTHETERKPRSRNDREGNSKRCSPISNSSKRNKTCDEDFPTKLGTRNKEIALLQMSDRASSLKDNDLRSKLKKQRNRSGNVSGEEALTVIQSESPSNALIKDNKNDRGITSSIKGDSPSIPKETDLRVLLNKQRMETVVDEEFQSGRPSETLFTDLRADLNNTGSKPADFRQIIEKTRTSRTHERSLEGTKIDDIGHHKDKSDSSLDSYYTPLAAGSMGMGTYSKQYENSETRRVKSVNLRTNEERYPKAYTSIHRDSGYNDHVSKDVENERAIIKYDDLFDA